VHRNTLASGRSDYRGCCSLGGTEARVGRIRRPLLWAGPGPMS